MNREQKYLAFDIEIAQIMQVGFQQVFAEGKQTDTMHNGWGLKLKVVTGRFKLGSLPLTHPNPQVGFVGRLILTERRNSKIV